VGGGLAGLSTAYHLLDKSANKNSTNTMYENEGQTLDITIFDKVAPGTGGASSVAGGLLHPFSPSGKLIYLGQEGLESSINLINIAKQYSSDPDKVILRDKLFRLAQTDTHVKQLLNTASDYPQYAKWQSAHDLKTTCGDISNCLGGLELRNGCKVIHVPSYLQGLWKACQARSSNNEIKCHLIGSNDLTKSSLLEFDTVVLSAGSGLFHDSILQSDDFPVQLVRGQSIEMSFDIDNHLHREALLCGKYVTPTTNDNEILIGSTHEYETKPWDQDKVLEELKSKTKYLPPYAWNGTINKVTMGYRVQSKRGKYGRLLMIGQLQYPELHHDLWLFTGLSSRGLIYHGIFGDILSDAILAESDSATESRYPNLVWWKKDNQSF
jgi:glycine/D-amino acid oxidase-like deaminating enzyme